MWYAPHPGMSASVWGNVDKLRLIRVCVRYHIELPVPVRYRYRFWRTEGNHRNRSRRRWPGLCCRGVGLYLPGAVSGSGSGADAALPAYAAAALAMAKSSIPIVGVLGSGGLQRAPLPLLRDHQQLGRGDGERVPITPHSLLLCHLRRQSASLSLLDDQPHRPPRLPVPRWPA